ncbi:MAG: hypothetical protein AB8B95_03345 [Pseudohongiellaceae bacterium]
MLAAALVLVGFAVPEAAQPYFLNTGLFALSGGLTNMIAIHMLFERVPGLYGSGVVQLRFEEFKLGIRRLIMEQFFDKADISSFLTGAEGESTKIKEKMAESLDELDLAAAFESLLDVIMNSSFSGMLGMIGGRDALRSLQEPFVQKMKDFFQAELAGPSMESRIQSALKSAIDDNDIKERLETIIDLRLNEMTPHMVKVIVQDMIHKHLGWLVVWGCAFGGLLGLIVAIVGAL